MEPSRKLKHEALDKPSQINLNAAATVYLLLAIVIVTWTHNDKYQATNEQVFADQQQTNLDESLKIAIKPKGDIHLVNQAKFGLKSAIDSPLKLLLEELLFIDNLLTVGNHNVASLCNLNTYYIRQTSDKLNLVRGEKQSSFDNYRANHIDGAVSAPAAELKKNSNIVGKWFNRLTKSEADYEIPNYPLDQQPNPDKITHIDADLRDCTDVIKNQQACGACYAFSWLSLAEWHYCKQKGDGKVVDFSEQHIVDCGQVAHLRGCVEGKLSDAKDFSQVFGIHFEQDYPYTSKQASSCKSRQGKLTVKVNDFLRIKVDRDQFEQILSEQPILLEVHLPSDIGSYSSGIHPGSNCDSQLGHGMLLVGHGRQDGKPYWLLRNSMGKKWGENGYLRLSRDLAVMDKCFKSAFVAKFRFKELDEEKYRDLYDSFKFEPTIDQNSRSPPLDVVKLLKGASN